MDQFTIEAELSRLTLRSKVAFLKNAPPEAIKKESLESLEDIVLFLRSVEPQGGMELLKLIAINPDMQIIFELASEHDYSTLQLNVISDSVARNPKLGKAFHDLLQFTNLRTAMNLLNIARKDLESLASNYCLNTLIDPLNDARWNWEISRRNRKDCFDTMIELLEEIAAAEGATEAFARNQSYRDTCSAFAALMENHDYPTNSRRIKNALESLFDRHPLSAKPGELPPKQL